jgi:hypothetical protein
MSTSERTFSQVKAILGKLDRSIDEARERRTQRPAAPVAPAPAPVRENTSSVAPTQSQYGRAQPIPARLNGNGTARWGGGGM